MFEKIIQKIEEAECIGIFTHANPDGDALGSSFSLRSVLRDMDKRAEVFLCRGWDPTAFALVGASGGPDFSVEECDLLIALDCADAKRLGIWMDFFEKHPNTVAIDHHITHIQFAGIAVVENISSTCEFIYRLYKELGVLISKEAASDLYIGITTDTGCFKYSSVTGDTLRTAAELIDTGIDFAGISKRIFDTVTREYMELQKVAMENLSFFCNGKMAVLRISDDEFEACKIDESASSAIVTLPVSVEGVEVGVYMRQRKNNEVKVSLRSVNKVDVAQIASIFGGGGHLRAAGYSIKKEEADKNFAMLLTEVEKRLKV